VRDRRHVPSACTRQRTERGLHHPCRGAEPGDDGQRPACGRRTLQPPQQAPRQGQHRQPAQLIAQQHGRRP
jgi:hypothetical protein